MDMTRFEILHQLGEGTFSKIYLAYDHKLQMKVALKVEKEDKHKNMLKYEYEILKNLQGLPHIPKIFEFVESHKLSKNKTIKNKKINIEGLNFIVMELLGKNITNFKKTSTSLNSIQAYEILLQMLDAIENLHHKGYIHRDIKPNNFVLGKEHLSNDGPQSQLRVYMIDYGLAKAHLDKYMRPFEERKNTDFRGTVTYASLNTHYKKDLSRRDDLWSFFFVILELLNETLPWRACKDDKEEIKRIKEVCLLDPENKLLVSTLKGKTEIMCILNHIKSLSYVDMPNYSLIKTKLLELKIAEMKKYSYVNLFNSQLRLFPDYSNLQNIFNQNMIGSIQIPNQINMNQIPSSCELNPNYTQLESNVHNRPMNFLDLINQNNFTNYNGLANSNNLGITPEYKFLENYNFNPSMKLPINTKQEQNMNILIDQIQDKSQTQIFNDLGQSTNANYIPTNNHYLLYENLIKQMQLKAYLNTLNINHNEQSGNLLDSFIGQKRARDEPIHNYNQLNNNANSTQPNQILIINQFNEKPEFNSNLINYLIANKNEEQKPNVEANKNENSSNNITKAKPKPNNTNDLNLINSIINNLPSRKREKTNLKKNDPTKDSQINKDTLMNIRILLNQLKKQGGDSNLMLNLSQFGLMNQIESHITNNIFLNQLNLNKTFPESNKKKIFLIQKETKK